MTRRQILQRRRERGRNIGKVSAMQKSLAGQLCPGCKREVLEFYRVENYVGRTVVDGPLVCIPVAWINECSRCGVQLITDWEAKRWEREFGVLPEVE